MTKMVVHSAFYITAALETVLKVEYFSTRDIKGLTKLSDELGWYTERDWEFFINNGVVFGHRLQEGEIVSSGCLTNFSNQVGWLAAFVVNSKFQGKKLGKAMLAKAMTMVPDEDFVLGLISTERGKRMYESAGFVEIGNTRKFVSAELPQDPNIKEELVREFRETDFEKVIELDRSAVGYDRSKFLRRRIDQSLSTAVFQNPNGDVQGFTIIFEGPRKVIGPLVAENKLIASALLNWELAKGGSFRIDIPHWQNDLIKRFENSEFTLERICPLMTFKGKPLPVTSDNYFALIAQAFG